MTTVTPNSGKPLFVALLILSAMFLCHSFYRTPPCHAKQSKGIEVVIADSSGERVGLYEGSYALLVGVSDYTAGWPDLGSVPGELDRVEAAGHDAYEKRIKVDSGRAVSLYVELFKAPVRRGRQSGGGFSAVDGREKGALILLLSPRRSARTVAFDS